jgi:hypothetical protein
MKIMVKKHQRHRPVVWFKSYSFSGNKCFVSTMPCFSHKPQHTLPTEKVISRFPTEPSNRTVSFPSCCTRSPREELEKRVINVLKYSVEKQEALHRTYDA